LRPLGFALFVSVLAVGFGWAIDHADTALSIQPAAVGTPINFYSPDPEVRMRQLLHQSEELRQIGIEWERLQRQQEMQRLKGPPAAR
jgi:hypothetical protein